MGNIYSRSRLRLGFNSQRFQWLLFALVPFFFLSCVAVGLIVHYAGVSDVNTPEPEPEPEPEPQTKVRMKRKI